MSNLRHAINLGLFLFAVWLLLSGHYTPLLLVLGVLSTLVVVLLATRADLIEEIFARHLSNPSLDIQADAVPLALNGSDVMFTTDGFIVQPLEFPGGNIGSLAVHGTTNDLAVAGAIPKYLSLNAFIEEGMEIT
ncbi:MAG: AIR synthase related protein, partial [Gammaproteobacteria bacterium]|nr:AIR synthase related protein [Gammaproteobacteria bacterium]